MLVLTLFVAACCFVMNGYVLLTLSPDSRLAVKDPRWGYLNIVLGASLWAAHWLLILRSLNAPTTLLMLQAALVSLVLIGTFLVLEPLAWKLLGKWGVVQHVAAQAWQVRRRLFGFGLLILPALVVSLLR